MLCSSVWWWQNTERGPTANHAVHGALAGHIQSAIARLHPQIRVFGDFMYAAEQSDDIREAAEEVVFLMVVGKSPRMTAAKREKLEFVVRGVMRRYRHMHQGGQSSNEDPLANAEKFRAWMWQVYEVRLESCNWDRDWGWGAAADLRVLRRSGSARVKPGCRRNLRNARGRMRAYCVPVRLMA